MGANFTADLLRLRARSLRRRLEKEGGNGPIVVELKEIETCCSRDDMTSDDLVIANAALDILERTSRPN